MATKYMIGQILQIVGADTTVRVTALRNLAPVYYNIIIDPKDDPHYCCEHIVGSPESRESLLVSERMLRRVDTVKTDEEEL